MLSQKLGSPLSFPRAFPMGWRTRPLPTVSSDRSRYRRLPRFSGSDQWKPWKQFITKIRRRLSYATVMSRPVRSRPARVTNRLNSPRRNHTHLTASRISLSRFHDVKKHFLNNIPLRSSQTIRNYPENFQAGAWDILSRQSYTKVPNLTFAGAAWCHRELVCGMFHWHYGFQTWVK